MASDVLIASVMSPEVAPSSNSTGIDDYSDFSVGVNRDFGPLNLAVGYYGTDSAGDDNFGDAADNRFMLTLSIGG